METEATTPAESVEEPKGMRAIIERLTAENKELKADKMQDALSKIGLNPEQGLGKAIVKEYNGDVSLEAISEYAKNEYAYEGSVVSTHPEAQAITEGTQRLESVGATAGSIANPTQQELLAKAEAEGDVDTTLALKGQEVASWFAGGKR